MAHEMVPARGLEPQPTDYKSVALPVELGHSFEMVEDDGFNRRPSACKADALPAELILHVEIYYKAWQRPTLAERKSDYHRR